MRKLILAAVAGTAFALAGCDKTPAPVATDTASADAATSDAADASSAAAEPSTAPKM